MKNKKHCAIIVQALNKERRLHMINDMTKGSPIKLILSFMVPLLIGNIFQQFYNMADTIIVGRTISVEALAALVRQVQSHF